MHSRACPAVMVCPAVMAKESVAGQGTNLPHPVALINGAEEGPRSGGHTQPSLSLSSPSPAAFALESTNTVLIFCGLKNSLHGKRQCKD